MTARHLSLALHLPLVLTRRALVAALPVAFFPVQGLGQEARPKVWARPVVVAGLPNLHEVTPLFWRAAQPDAAGFRAAEALGIRTVISMRQTVKDAPLAAGTGLTLVRVPMKARHVAEDHGARVVAAMRALRSGMGQGPVLVHCHHGADRTGLICALWRILYQGWSRQAALDELILGGYGFHPIWANIPRYIAKVDLTELRARIEA